MDVRVSKTKHTSSGPVEILRDRHGPYGIGILEQYDLEAIALACGVDPYGIHQTTPRHLILRPDRFELSKPGRAALQMITGGFQHGPFEQHWHNDPIDPMGRHAGPHIDLSCAVGERVVLRGRRS
jgi:hypothetical protein